MLLADVIAQTLQRSNSPIHEPVDSGSKPEIFGTSHRSSPEVAAQQMKAYDQLHTQTLLDELEAARKTLPSMEQQCVVGWTVATCHCPRCTAYRDQYTSERG